MEWLYRLAGRDFKQDYGAPGAGRGLCLSVPDPVALWSGTAAINRKARLYRVHKTFYQITEELKEKAAAVKADSVGFMEGFGEEEHGSDQ